MADERLPASSQLDRSALERVLARAAELQSGGAEPGEEFTEQQILELGREVGLSPQHIQQALAEERTRVALPDEPRGLTSRLLGPSRVGASHTVSGKPESVLAAIDAWMQRQQWLQVKRQFPDRIVWEARRDLVGAVRRAFRVGGHDYELSRAREVAATAVAIDDRRVLVRLDADFQPQRSALVRDTALGTFVGVAGSASLLVMGFATIAVPLPAIVLATVSYQASRSAHRRVITRAQLALEQLLDRLERTEPGRQPSLLGLLTAAAALPPRRDG